VSKNRNNKKNSNINTRELLESVLGRTLRADVGERQKFTDHPVRYARGSAALVLAVEIATGTRIDNGLPPHITDLCEVLFAAYDALYQVVNGVTIHRNDGIGPTGQLEGQLTIIEGLEAMCDAEQ
jgi:hypothetical protein